MVRLNWWDCINNDPEWINEAMKNLVRQKSLEEAKKSIEEMEKQQQLDAEEREKVNAYKELANAFFGAKEEAQEQEQEEEFDPSKGYTDEEKDFIRLARKLFRQ